MSTCKSFRVATLALAITGLLAATSASAGPGGADRDPSRHLERMTEQLDLTTEQQDGIRTILDEQRLQIEQQRREMQTQIGAVLTPEQLARIEERRDTRMQRHVDRLAHRLELSTDQVAQVRSIIQAKADDPSLARDELREQIKAVLTEDQLKAFEAGGPRAKRGGADAPCAKDAKAKGQPRDDAAL
jgi:periplasmic protein CpxP/Spy